MLFTDGKCFETKSITVTGTRERSTTWAFARIASDVDA
jgi:hypothetical protein